jgi:hypothetical protein
VAADFAAVDRLIDLRSIELPDLYLQGLLQIYFKCWKVNPHLILLNQT